MSNSKRQTSNQLVVPTVLFSGVTHRIWGIVYGRLCDWTTTPFFFGLKDHAKPYDGWSFPVPRLHKNSIVKESNRLYELVVFPW